MASGLEPGLEHQRVRIQRSRLGVLLRRHATVALALAILLEALALLGVVPQLVVAVVPLVLLVATIGWALRRRLSLPAVAQLLDQRLRLFDRLGTALELERRGCRQRRSAFRARAARGGRGGGPARGRRRPVAAAGGGGTARVGRGSSGAAGAGGASRRRDRAGLELRSGWVPRAGGAWRGALQARAPATRRRSNTIWAARARRCPRNTCRSQRGTRSVPPPATASPARRPASAPPKSTSPKNRQTRPTSSTALGSKTSRSAAKPTKRSQVRRKRGTAAPKGAPRLAGPKGRGRKAVTRRRTAGRATAPGPPRARTVRGRGRERHARRQRRCARG